ncbi:MAG: pyrroline-5-carboxylate reductase [Thermodesulfobacteriota bacterium]
MGKIGFIGGGNMAEALIKGLIMSGKYKKIDIIVSDTVGKRLDHLKSAYGVLTTKDNKESAGKSDIIILSVKPNVIRKVVSEIKTQVTAKKILISIAAGIPTSLISDVLKKKAKIVRVMPNTPALVLAGASALFCSPNLSSEDRESIKRIFESVGIVYVVDDERLLDTVTGLSGSGPAFVSMFIEALSDGGVKMGLPREAALKLAAQTVFGTAKMIIEEMFHPAVMKDKVSSPGGTTIEGIHKLESGGFRANVISAVEAATHRSRQISKEEK